MSLLSVVTFLTGLALLVGGAELLVRGASRLAQLLRVSPLIIGLTIVAYGTSMPELVISLNASISGEMGIAVGNVVGSNIFNVLGILGLSALIAPLVVSSRLVRFDVPLMIGASAVLFLMALDGTIGQIEGGILVAGLIAYTFTMWFSQRRGAKNDGIVDNGKAEQSSRVKIALDAGFIIAGLVLLVIGSNRTVSGASDIAAALGVSDVIIGLTVVSAGTSMPELVTSILAALRGERDLAVGNVVGSNIFNILGVQGMASMVTAAGVIVEPSVINQDLPIMLSVAIASLPIFFTGYVIARWEGALFVGYLAAYLIYLYAQAVQREALGFFNLAMVAFVIPITVLTLVIVLIREFRRRRNA